MLRMFLACVLASFAGLPGAAEVEVAPCSAVWSVTLTRDGSAFRRGDYCVGGRRGMELTDLEDGRADEHAWIAFEPGPDAADVIVRDSETGPIRARGTVRWETTSPQPLAVEGSRKLAIELNPLAMEQPVQIIAENASVGEVLVALRDAAGINIRSDVEIENRLTLRFAAAPVNAVLSMLIDIEGLIVIHDAAGTRHLRTPRDAFRLQSLRAQFEASASQGSNREVEHRILEEIRALVRLRGADDVPPGARYELGLLADAYRRDARYPEQIEIRREMLRTALRYDARPDSPDVAIARLDLASALDHVAGAGAEARSLVVLASTVVGKGFTESGVDAALHADTLAHHGRSALALRHLESNYRACNAGDALGWLLDMEHLHILLLRRYADTDRTADFDRLLDDWRRCALGETHPAQAIRISRAFDRIEASRFAEAARTLELILLRIPDATAMDPDELAYLHQRALFASLGAGHWHRAAVLLDVLQASQTQRPDALEAQQQRELQVLRVLADAGQDPSTAAERVLAPRLARTKGRAAAEPALILDFQVLAVTLAAARTPADANRDDLIVVREAAFVLSPVVDAHPALSNDPVVLLRDLKDLRRADGADDAEIARRESELQRLRAVVEQAWLGGRETPSAT